MLRFDSTEYSFSILDDINIAQLRHRGYKRSDNLFVRIR